MERPQTTYGYTARIRTGCGWLYITRATSNSYQEVFCKLGKSGGCPGAFLDSIGRLITFTLNKGVPHEEVIRALIGVRCPSPYGFGEEEVFSCPDAIAKALKGAPNEQS